VIRKRRCHYSIPCRPRLRSRSGPEKQANKHPARNAERQEAGRRGPRNIEEGNATRLTSGDAAGRRRSERGEREIGRWRYVPTVCDARRGRRGSGWRRLMREREGGRESRGGEEEEANKCRRWWWGAQEGEEEEGSVVGLRCGGEDAHACAWLVSYICSLRRRLKNKKTGNRITLTSVFFLF